MNILTFDIEEWFHILDHPGIEKESSWNNFESRINNNVDRILSLLSDSNNLATFFCLGWVAEKYPEIIKKIDAGGHEIGSHSNTHQLISKKDRNFFKNDLEISINRLQDIIGKKVISYRAPGFSLTEDDLWVFEDLIENGIELDCSIFSAKHSHGGGHSNSLGFGPSKIKFNGMTIKEFPVNSIRILNQNLAYSGGGYFRLIPYFLLANLIKNNDYNMTYFHPRDFDKDQPIIQDLSYLRKFKSYYGLSGAYKKAKKLLNNFDFISLGEANRLIDWSNRNQFNLIDGKLV
jgi:polysaccharide deacetylase family protein (PEP-CTERM system associated)